MRKTVNWARVISIILHPLLFLTVVFGLLLYVSPVAALPVSEENKWRLLLVIFVFTCLAPLTSLLIFYTTGSIQSLLVNNLRDYRMSLWVVFIFYLTSAILFTNIVGFKELPFIKVVVGANAFILFIMVVVSYVWPICPHSTASSAVLGVLFGTTLRFAADNMLYPILILIVLSGGLMSARLYLNAQTPQQVLAGIFLGFTFNLLSVVALL